MNTFTVLDKTYVISAVQIQSENDLDVLGSFYYDQNIIHVHTYKLQAFENIVHHPLKG